MQAAYEQGLSHNAYYEYQKQQRDEQSETEQQEPQPIKLDAGDPYFYFHQFRDEPQTMASELAAMLLGFNLDEQQTVTLLDLLKKELKAQRKQLLASVV